MPVKKFKSKSGRTVQRLSAPLFLVFECCLYISCMLLYSYEEEKERKKNRKKEKLILNSQIGKNGQRAGKGRKGKKSDT